MLSPLDLWRMSLQTGLMLAEAQTVCAMRMLGGGPPWPGRAETARAAESWAALARAGHAAQLALLTGRDPVQTAADAPRPARRRPTRRRR
jgi:hypothetical protein